MSIKSSKSEFERWHDYDVLPGDNTIYIGSTDYANEDETGVDHSMAERVIKNLHIMDKRIHNSGIIIKMNNIGGDVYHGMAIYDAIATCQNHVKIIIFGHAMSMGSYILQAADERVMTANSRMMLHAVQTEVSGNIYEIQESLKEAFYLQDMMSNVFLKRIRKVRPKYSKRNFINKIKKDWYLDPEEAISFGLCDKVLA